MTRVISSILVNVHQRHDNGNFPLQGRQQVNEFRLALAGDSHRPKDGR